MKWWIGPFIESRNSTSRGTSSFLEKLYLKSVERRPSTVDQLFDEVVRNLIIRKGENRFFLFRFSGIIFRQKKTDDHCGGQTSKFQ